MSQSTLHIPLQSAPVDRTPSGAAAFADAAGVEAAAWWDEALNIAGKVAPPLLSAFGI